MEMKMGMRLGMQQRLVMTPRLQQALKLLQMPTLELQQVLKQEILQNPLLEEVDDVLDTADEEKEEKEDEEPKEPANKDDQDEWDEFYDSAWASGGNPEVEEREDFVERVPVARQTFAEYLFSQLRLATEDDHVLELGDYIIGSLDDA